jgi:hypothetical protein
MLLGHCRTDVSLGNNYFGAICQYIFDKMALMGIYVLSIFHKRAELLIYLCQL